MALLGQITVPASTVDKLTALGRALIELAQEIQLYSDVKRRIKPQQVPKDQEWFWTEEWQRGEREVDEALAHGEYKSFDSLDALLADLHAHV
jgi:hypothetical protein